MLPSCGRLRELLQTTKCYNVDSVENCLLKNKELIAILRCGSFWKADRCSIGSVYRHRRVLVSVHAHTTFQIWRQSPIATARPLLFTPPGTPCAQPRQHLWAAILCQACSSKAGENYQLGAEQPLFAAGLRGATEGTKRLNEYKGKRKQPGVSKNITLGPNKGTFLQEPSTASRCHGRAYRPGGWRGVFVSLYRYPKYTKSVYKLLLPVSVERVVAFRLI